MAKIKLWVLVSALIFLTACYYDKEDELYPPNSGPKSNVSFSTDVLPILSNNCFVCHSTAAALGNVILEGHDQTLIYVNNGSLLGSIKHESNFIPMPNGSAKLSNTLIETIEVWIAEGAKNN